MKLLKVLLKLFSDRKFEKASQPKPKRYLGRSVLLEKNVHIINAVSFVHSMSFKI